MAKIKTQNPQPRSLSEYSDIGPMTDFPQPFPQQYFDDQLHGNSPSATGASWSAITSTSPQSPQSTPSSNRRPLPGAQPLGHTYPGLLHDLDVFSSMNAVGDRQVDGDWEDTVTMRPFVENTAARDQLQAPQDHDHIIPDCAQARVIRDAPTQAPVAPPAPAIDIINDDVQQTAGNPAPAFFDEVPRQGLVPNRRASEVLRQLALLYLNDPDSQLVMIRMGPSQDGEVTVDFTLRLTNL